MIPGIGAVQPLSYLSWLFLRKSEKNLSCSKYVLDRYIPVRHGTTVESSYWLIPCCTGHCAHWNVPVCTILPDSDPVPGVQDSRCSELESTLTLCNKLEQISPPSHSQPEDLREAQHLLHQCVRTNLQVFSLLLNNCLKNKTAGWIGMPVRLQTRNG